METESCKGCLYESRTGERLSHGYHVCDREVVIPARYAKDIPGCQNAVDYPIQPNDEIIMSYLTTEGMIDELKKRGLGTFNLSLPFKYCPKNAENDKARSH